MDRELAPSLRSPPLFPRLLLRRRLLLCLPLRFGVVVSSRPRAGTWLRPPPGDVWPSRQRWRLAAAASFVRRRLVRSLRLRGVGSSWCRDLRAASGSSWRRRRATLSCSRPVVPAAQAVDASSVRRRRKRSHHRHRHGLGSFRSMHAFVMSHGSGGAVLVMANAGGRIQGGSSLAQAVLPEPPATAESALLFIVVQPPTGTALYSCS